MAELNCQGPAAKGDETFVAELTCQGPEAKGGGRGSHDTVAELASDGIGQALQGGLPSLCISHQATNAS